MFWGSGHCCLPRGAPHPVSLPARTAYPGILLGQQLIKLKCVLESPTGAGAPRFVSPTSSRRACAQQDPGHCPMSSWLSAAWRVPSLGEVLSTQHPGMFLESDEPLQGQEPCPPIQPAAEALCHSQVRCPRCPPLTSGECSPQSGGGSSVGCGRILAPSWHGSHPRSWEPLRARNS